MGLINSNFQKLPRGIYKLGLDGNEFFVLSYLLSLIDNKNIHPSKKTIANKTNMSKRTVDRTIKSLVSKNLISYERGFLKGDERICNRYRIHLEKIDSRCVSKIPLQLSYENENMIQFNEMISDSSKENNW